MPDRWTPTRRELLSAAGAASVVAVATGMSGCATDAPPEPAAQAAAAASDTALAARAAREAARMVALYRKSLRRHPPLRGLLQPLADHHAEHLAVLAPQQPPSVDDPSVPVPNNSGAVLAMLRRMEQATARSRRSAMLEARSGDLSRVLASVAACQAQHVLSLEAGP